MDSLKDLRIAIEQVSTDGDGYYTNEHERLQQLFQQQLKINEELIERMETLEQRYEKRYEQLGEVNRSMADVITNHLETALNLKLVERVEELEIEEQRRRRKRRIG